MKRIIQIIDKYLAVVENVLIVLLVTVMVFMAFFQVVLRNIFSTSILWGDIFLRHLVLWVGFIGASLATREEKHINIDILSRFASEKFRPLVRLFIDFISLVICVILARAAFAFVSAEMDAGTVLFNNIPAWYFQIIIPVGFLMIAFRFLLKMVEQIIFLLSPEVE